MLEKQASHPEQQYDRPVPLYALNLDCLTEINSIIQTKTANKNLKNNTKNK